MSIAKADSQILQRFSNEWETKQLGEIGEISGAGVDKKINPNEMPVRLVNYLDVYNKTFLYSKDLTHEVSARPDQLRHCAVEKGDIFFTPSSEVPDDIGCSAVAMEDISDGVYSYHVVRFRLKANWDLYFRAYVFNTEAFLSQASKQCEGSGTRYVISLPKFRAMTVRFPPTVEEQRAIAEVLSDVDGLLNALEALIAKKRAIKQAVMQQLLTGKTRLLGFSGEWKKTKMGNIGSIYGGLSGKSKVDFGGGNAHYVTFLGVLENIILDTRHTERVHVGSGESQNRVMKGDLLFNASSETPGDLAIGAVMGEQLDNLYLNSFCFGFRIHDEDKYVPLFLAYFFRGSVGRDIMNALAQGATRYNMSKSQFLALELSIPSCGEQSAIVSVLSDMDTEIIALEQRRDKTRSIKQGMMQQLLTERVRLVKNGNE